MSDRVSSNQAEPITDPSRQSDYPASSTMPIPLQRGAPAPDFELRRTPDQTLALSDLRGSPVLDGAWCQNAFCEHRNIRYSLLADFEPQRQLARDYQVYRNRDGVSERALFVIDPEGKVFWSYVSPIAVNPGADGILRALEEMSTSRVTA